MYDTEEKERREGGRRGGGDDGGEGARGGGKNHNKYRKDKPWDIASVDHWSIPDWKDETMKVRVRSSCPYVAKDNGLRVSFS